MSDIVYKNFKFSTPFLCGYRQLKMPIISPDGTPTWPEKFPLSRIEDLRQTVGARCFSAQMMLEYIAPERVRLDPGALHLYDGDFVHTVARVDNWDITGATVYWDPSSGRKNSDASVCVLIYRDDKTRRVFIHDVMYMVVSDSDLYPLAHQCEMVLEFLSRHCLRRIYIETNGMGNALPEIMRDVSSRHNMRISVQKTTNTKNKETRILDALEPLLTSGRLYAHQRVRSTPLISEMLGWTPMGGTTHDDGLDAVAGAICAIPTPIRPCGPHGGQFHAKTDFTI